MTSPHVMIVTDTNFEDEVLKAEKLVLIDFYADWCGPCKSLAPVLEKFAEENQDTVKVVKINVDENPALLAAFAERGIPLRSVPTLVTIKDGVPVFAVAGALPKAMLEKFVADSITEANAPAADKPAPKGPNGPRN